MSDKLVIIADSTQIDAFMQCERLWKYAHDERLAPQSLTDVSDKPAMLMGTLGHKYLERYYKALLTEPPLNTQTNALEYALAWNPDVQTCSCEHPCESHSGDGFGNVCNEDDCPCLGFIAKPFPLDKPNRAIVQQRFREYCYTYSHNDIVPTSPDHIEVGFSEPLYEDSEHLFILEGRVDLMGSLSGMSCVMDHKFQLRRHDLFKKSIQFRNYAMVTGASLLVLNMIRLAKAVDNKTFERLIASFTTEEHRWWRGQLIEVFKRMAAARVSGRYEQNWSACAGKYGYECDFTKLCDPTESDPQLIEAKKRTLYQIKPEWKPW